MQVLSLNLKGDTVHFTVKMGCGSTVTSRAHCGESLLFGRVVRRIHTNYDFYKGMRLALMDIVLNQLRLEVNEKLNELVDN